MKHFLTWLFIAFVVLHNPDGQPIYFVPAQVVAVYPTTIGGKGSQTAVFTLNGTLYVRESVEDAVKIFQDAK
jgi:hypothetical protein